MPRKSIMKNSFDRLPKDAINTVQHFDQCDDIKTMALGEECSLL